MIEITETLVRNLVATQIPQWKDLPVKAVTYGGWDNRTFHLGSNMLVRLPSGQEYAPKVAKEHQWLPILSPLLPLPIPTPLFMGKSGSGYPWPWSVYGWIPGDTASSVQIPDKISFAKNLAEFLLALHKIDPTNGPLPGPDVTSRGGSLTIYDDETRKALALLTDKIDIVMALAVWEQALTTIWNRPPVWVHGDISLGNLLVQDGKLSAVIDFGGLVTGDPACDLAIAWTFFNDESRKLFQDTLALDEGTWARGRGWTLWKAAIVASGLCQTNNVEGEDCFKIINEVLEDYKLNR